MKEYDIRTCIRVRRFFLIIKFINVYIFQRTSGERLESPSEKSKYYGNEFLKKYKFYNDSLNLGYVFALIFFSSFRFYFTEIRSFVKILKFSKSINFYLAISILLLSFKFLGEWPCEVKRS